MKFFHLSVRLTNEKPGAFVCPFDKPIKSLYFRSFVVSVLFARFHFKVIRKSLYHRAWVTFVGINTLNQILPNMCSVVDCLRLTCATTLFNAGIDEKLIREGTRTVHRSNTLFQYDKANR